MGADLLARFGSRVVGTLLVVEALSCGWFPLLEVSNEEYSGGWGRVEGSAKLAEDAVDSSGDSESKKWEI